MTKKRKVLVTGANGLIGSRIAELADLDFDIITMSKTKNEWVDYVVDFKNVEEITEVSNHSNIQYIIPKVLLLLNLQRSIGPKQRS
jgi:dTDP-4-dehydrorhamnose reductase